MKFKRSFFSILMVLLLTSLTLAGCAKTKEEEKPPAMDCPFSELTWDSTYDNMIELEGEPTENHPSVYNGTTYSYPMNYMDLDGTVKYMFDENNELMCIAWACAGDKDNLQESYDTIKKDLVDTFGESGYNTSNATNYGDVWYLDDGHIILSVVTTDQQKALQYSYQSPAASEEEDADSTADTAE